MNLRFPGSIATTSTPITTIATPDYSHQSQPVRDSTCSCLPLFISEIRNGRATLQPSQRLSQIRPFSPFHNTRERKGKKTPRSSFILSFYLCSLSNSTFNTHSLNRIFVSETTTLRTPALKFPNQREILISIYFVPASLLEYPLMQCPYGGLNQSRNPH